MTGYPLDSGAAGPIRSTGSLLLADNVGAQMNRRHQRRVHSDGNFWSHVERQRDAAREADPHDLDVEHRVRVMVCAEPGEHRAVRGVFDNERSDTPETGVRAIDAVWAEVYVKSKGLRLHALPMPPARGREIDAWSPA